MKSLAKIMAEIIAAEKRKAMHDAVTVIMLTQDCRLTGAVMFEDYDPCFSELCTVERMN